MTARSKEHQKFATLCHLDAANSISASSITELLLTAATPSHREKAEALLALQGLQDVDVDMVKAVLFAAAQCDDPQLLSTFISSLPAGTLQQLQPVDVLSILHNPHGTGLDDRGVCGKIHALEQVPAAQQIVLDSVHGLLQRAVQLTSCETTTRLCDLPAAKRIASEDVSTLMMAALAAGGHWKVEALARLPGALCLDAEAAKQLLYAAVCSEQPLLTELLKLPAVCDLGAPDVISLFMAASEGAAGQIGKRERAAIGVTRQTCGPDFLSAALMLVRCTGLDVADCQHSALLYTAAYCAAISMIR